MTSTIRDGSARYVLSVDVGTTNILAQVFTPDLHIASQSNKSVTNRHPTTDRYELDPNELWTAFQDVVKETIQNSNLTAADMTCMGISVQRNSFLLWDRSTGKPRTPVITWQDLRATAYVRDVNSSIYMKCLQMGSRLLYWITGQTRYLAASVLRLKSSLVGTRLHYVLQNDPQLLADAQRGTVCMGCLESWFLWNLTEGRMFASDYSCASAFGFYDPFTLEWSSIFLKLFKIPIESLPEVRDTSGDFSETSESIFGARIPIRCLIGDQQAATVAEGCVNVGQVKVTLGTGSFINVNTGTKAHASVKGMYPTIGWKIKDQVTYIAEGNHRDTGTTIDWLKKINFFKDYSELTELAESVKISASSADDSDVYFVPAFNGLVAPVMDDMAACLFVGIRAWTTRAEMVHAVLDAIVMMTKQLVDIVREETGYAVPTICVNGNVARNDWLMQRLADLLQIPIKRSQQQEASCLGAAMMAGLAAGVWQSESEFCHLRQDFTIFKPRPECLPELERRFLMWRRAVERAKSWYNS